MGHSPLVQTHPIGPNECVIGLKFLGTVDIAVTFSIQNLLIVVQS